MGVSEEQFIALDRGSSDAAVMVPVGLLVALEDRIKQLECELALERSTIVSITIEGK